MKTVQSILLVLLTTLLFAQTGDLQSYIPQLERQLTGTSKDIPTLIKLGVLCHKIVQKQKNDAFLKKGEQYLKQVLKYDDKNALALIWLGSLTTIKGRDAWMPWNKLKYVEEGTKLMDKAVRYQPNSLSVRFIRASNNSSLPGFFNRIDTAIVDYQYIIKKVEATDSLQHIYSLPELYMSLAQAYRLKGETDKSIALWEKVHTRFPDSAEASNAEKNLKEYED